MLDATQSLVALNTRAACPYEDTDAGKVARLRKDGVILRNTNHDEAWFALSDHSEHGVMQHLRSIRGTNNSYRRVGVQTVDVSSFPVPDLSERLLVLRAKVL